MAYAFDETKNTIWRFLMLALRPGVDIVRGEGSGREIAKHAASSCDHSFVPAKYQSSKEIYDFRIGTTLYHICLDETAELQKDQEYFNRGSRFVKDLLNAVFNKYRILVVNNAVYPDVDIDISNFIDGTATLISKENDCDDASAHYRYRVGFAVVVKDQIDKKVTTETFLESLTIESTNGGLIYRRENVDPPDAISTDACFAPVVLPDQDARRNAMRDIANALQTNKEKAAIFDLFRNERDSAIAKHIASRERRAKEVADCGEPVYRYNVTAHTMYIDKMQDKIYTYRLQKGEYSQKLPVRFNPKDGLQSITCPCCGKAITSTDSNKICLALDKDKKPIICCFACSVDLSKQNDLYAGESLARYVNDPSCVTRAVYWGSERLFYIGDTYTNVLDNNRRYSMAGSAVPQYLFDGKVLSDNQEHRLPKGDDWVFTCPNCQRTYGRKMRDRNKFEQYIIKPQDRENVKGCVKCADNPEGKKKWDIFKSELSNTYFVNPANGAKCHTCNKIGCSSELSQCDVCGRQICQNCGISRYWAETRRTRRSLNFCSRCIAYLERNARANKTACDKKESLTVWENVKSNIPLYLWSRRKRIYKETDAKGVSLYYVVFVKSNEVYCFEKEGKRYIRLFPKV